MGLVADAGGGALHVVDEVGADGLEVGGGLHHLRLVLAHRSGLQGVHDLLGLARSGHERDVGLVVLIGVGSLGDALARVVAGRDLAGSAHDNCGLLSVGGSCSACDAGGDGGLHLGGGGLCGELLLGFLGRGLDKALVGVEGGVDVAELLLEELALLVVLGVLEDRLGRDEDLRHALLDLAARLLGVVCLALVLPHSSHLGGLGVEHALALNEGAGAGRRLLGVALLCSGHKVSVAVLLPVALLHKLLLREVALRHVDGRELCRRRGDFHGQRSLCSSQRLRLRRSSLCRRSLRHGALLLLAGVAGLLLLVLVLHHLDRLHLLVDGGVERGELVDKRLALLLVVEVREVLIALLDERVAAPVDLVRSLHHLPPPQRRLLVLRKLPNPRGKLPSPAAGVAHGVRKGLGVLARSVGVDVLARLLRGRSKPHRTLEERPVDNRKKLDAARADHLRRLHDVPVRSAAVGVPHKLVGGPTDVHRGLLHVVRGVQDVLLDVGEVRVLVVSKPVCNLRQNIGGLRNNADLHRKVLGRNSVLLLERDQHENKLGNCV